MAQATDGDMGKVEGAAQKLAMFLFPDAHDNYINRLAKLWVDFIQDNYPLRVDESHKIFYRPVCFYTIYPHRRRTRVRCVPIKTLAHQITSSEGAYLNGNGQI